MPNVQNDVEEKDLQERVESFNKEMVPLLGKYELGIGAVVTVTPDGRLLPAPRLYSTRQKPDDGQATPDLVKE